VRSAVVAALDHLNRNASGRWEFQSLDGDEDVIDLSWDERLTLPITLEDGTLAAALRLRPSGVAAMPAEERAEARSFATVLGALISAEGDAQVARHSAAVATTAALSDQLTGLANRRAWRQSLRREEKRCERSGVVAAIAVVDLDDLKEVNDRHGHLAGDLLIKLAADTITREVRGADLVARLGGDEFGVLAVDYEEPTAAPLVLRVRNAIEAADVVASVGGALHRSGADIMRTFHEADMDMYEAKRVRKMVRARGTTD
jgi:diguanylate cyclase